MRLEPLEEKHAEGLAAVVRPGDDVFAFTNTAPRTVEEMRAWIAARWRPRWPGSENVAFLQRDPTSGASMGSTSLFDIDRSAQSAEIGHTWLAAPFRRTGVNTEAKALLFGYAFETLGLRRVQLVTDVRNLRSQAAIERLGAVREGVLRNYRRRLDGSLRDSVVYSVTDAEWPAVRQALAVKLRP